MQAKRLVIDLITEWSTANNYSFYQILAWDLIIQLIDLDEFIYYMHYRLSSNGLHLKSFIHRIYNLSCN